MKEAYPLQWPDDVPRTRIDAREERKGWKKTVSQAIDALELELKRLGAFSCVLTRKDPNDVTGAKDPSVAVYFSRHREDDYSWQDALQIANPAPAKEDIDSAFRRLSAKHHPDSILRGSGGDIEIWHALFKHKENALAYVNRLEGRKPDYVIACDKFKETRWNINAIRMTIASLRQIERDGTSGFLERAMRGFAALPEAREAAHVVSAAS